MPTQPLTKQIAATGRCSRRQAEAFIRAGKVRVNGETAVLGTRVFPNDRIDVDGERLDVPGGKVYVILNKPEGFVCTNRHFHGERNVFDLLVDRSGRNPRLKERLFVVGRLDKNSRGLVLLTNDGDLAYRLEHPRHEEEKEYEVSSIKYQVSSIEGRRVAKQLESGIDIGEGDGVVKAKRARYDGDGKFTVVLTGGKKRQIRRMFKALGLEVSDLVRTRMGRDLILDDLKEGKWRCLKCEEVEKLRRSSN